MVTTTLRCLSLAAMCFLSGSNGLYKVNIENQITSIETIKDISEGEMLLFAIMYVESGGDSTKWAKGEDAVGCLQIRRIAVRDANRILKKQKKKKRYKYKDRWSCVKSKEMFAILTEYYLPGGCYEDIARFWNGGPRGPIKESTKKYWRKVRRRLNKMAKEN